MPHAAGGHAGLPHAQHHHHVTGRLPVDQRDEQEDAGVPWAFNIYLHRRLSLFANEIPPSCSTLSPYFYLSAGRCQRQGLWPAYCFKTFPTAYFVYFYYPVFYVPLGAGARSSLLWIVDMEWVSLLGPGLHSLPKIFHSGHRCWGSYGPVKTGLEVLQGRPQWRCSHMCVLRSTVMSEGLSPQEWTDCLSSAPHRC